MPYDNVPDELQDKMETCVQQVMEKGEDKDAAIAICYTSVVEGKTLDEAVKAVRAGLAGLSAKVGRRNNTSDRATIREIRTLARGIVDHTVSLEPNDTDDDAPDAPAPAADTVILTAGKGHEIKALGDGRVGGYLVRFGSPEQPDLEGEYFTKDTDYGDYTTAPVYYQHALDAVLGRRKLGKAVLKADDFGVWAEAQLALIDEYEQFIYAQIEAGKMGWSSGTAPHLVERQPQGKATHITAWPLGLDASITPTPAEPRNAVMPLKSYQVSPWHMPEAAPEAAPEMAIAASAAIPPNVIKSVQVKERSTMEDNNTVAPVETKPQDDAIKALNARLEEMGANLNRVLQHIQDSPSLRSAGFVTNDGGKADKGVKSFADYLTAIKRNDHTRLTSVYGVKASTLAEDSGALGGYLVPEEYRTELLQVVNQNSAFLGKITRIPVGSDAGTFPALDQFTAATAGSGNTPYAAGVVATATAEGGTLTETNPGFTDVNWRVNKIGGYTLATNELMRDSIVPIEMLLRQLFGVAVASKEEFYALRGNGVGVPLGILNAGCAVGVSPDTDAYWGYADAVEMVSRFKPVGSGAMWLAHRSIVPDTASWEIGTNGAGAPTLEQLGYGGLQFSDHLPQANNAGCVVLVDWGAYLFFVRDPLSIAYSEHANFTSEKGTWRFSERIDGQPWMKNAVTLPDPQGSYTVSPVVYFND